MDADTQARLVFNRMAVDFSNMIQRQDLDYSLFKQPAGTLPATYGGGAIPVNLQTGNDQLAFYGKGTGFFSSGSAPSPSAKASLALVGYNVAADPYLNNRFDLQRMSQGLGWEPVNGFPNIGYLPTLITTQWGTTSASLFSTPAYWDTVGDQVFRFEYTYLLKANTSPANLHPAKLSTTPYWDSTMTTPPHTAINGFQDVAAIVVGIAVLDSTSDAILTNGGNTSLVNSLPDVSGTSDIESVWLPIVNSGSFAQKAGIPKEAASAVRIYQRYFYLSAPQ